MPLLLPTVFIPRAPIGHPGDFTHRVHFFTQGKSKNGAARYRCGCAGQRAGRPRCPDSERRGKCESVEVGAVRLLRRWLYLHGRLVLPVHHERTACDQGGPRKDHGLQMAISLSVWVVLPWGIPLRSWVSDTTVHPC